MLLNGYGTHSTSKDGPQIEEMNRTFKELIGHLRKVEYASDYIDTLEKSYEEFRKRDMTDNTTQAFVRTT